MTAFEKKRGKTKSTDASLSGIDDATLSSSPYDQSIAKTSEDVKTQATTEDFDVLFAEMDESIYFLNGRLMILMITVYSIILFILRYQVNLC